MLDDLKLIHERDASDALGIAEKQGRQLTYEFQFEGEPAFDHVYNVVCAGMGGSALSGLLLHTWPAMKEPFEVVREYDLPGYVDSDTLVIASSYSGNTEETISALHEAAERGAQIAVVASGGKLVDIARDKHYPLLVLPQTDQPRYAVLYSFKAMLTVLHAAQLVDDSVLSAAAAMAPKLDKAVTAWLPTVPTAQNPAKKLALECIGKSIVIYSGPKLFPAAYKWKISFNENAKQVAWCNQLPEFNHNEFIGWSKQPVDKPYTVIDLRSTLEHERVQKRFVVSERLLSGMRPAPHVVEAQGDSILEQLLWTVAFGDFVSLYTALLNGLNPAPVDLVETF